MAARGYAHQRDLDGAVTTPLSAEQTAPEELRHSPRAHTLVSALLDASRLVPVSSCQPPRYDPTQPSATYCPEGLQKLRFGRWFVGQPVAAQLFWRAEPPVAVPYPIDIR